MDIYEVRFLETDEHFRWITAIKSSGVQSSDHTRDYHMTCDLDETI